MNKYIELFRKYNLFIEKISFINNNIIILCDDENQYLIKDKVENKFNVYAYLKDIEYPFYLEQINCSDDHFEIYNYYDNVIDDDYKKSKEIINAIILLHGKTYSYSNNDEIKRILSDYESLIDKTMKYYLDLQDYIDELDFLSPQYYLLLINISKVYRLLQISKSKLDALLSKDTLSIRKVICVNDCFCSNFNNGEKKYFISWDNSSIDYIIFDFINFYKSDYDIVDMISLFELYNQNIFLSSDELDFLLCILCIPNIVNFTNNNYSDTLLINNLIDYVEKTYNFVLKEDKEYEKAD